MMHEVNLLFKQQNFPQGIRRILQFCSLIQSRPAGRRGDSARLAKQNPAKSIVSPAEITYMVGFGGAA